MNVTGEVRQTVVDRRVSLDDAERIARGLSSITLADATISRCSAAFDRLSGVVAEERHVYGVTTGFGPLANRLVGAQSSEILQQNLVYHLASGVGECFSWTEARAIVLARVMALVQGASGARPETIHRLVAVLNSDLAPAIPARGTVGASGDLTPLAHLVLCLQGQGGFLKRDGTRIDAEAAFARIGITPLDLSHRDGLALVNGTSAMTGVAVLSSQRLQRALEWSTVLTAGMAEALGGRTEAWHPAFAQLRPHDGQAWATERLLAAIEGSDRVVRSFLAQRRLGLNAEGLAEDRAGQDAYSLRCAPQVIGAVRDTAGWTRSVVETELHSVTDNPIFPGDADVAALHGGNFMGVHVALASDAAALSATVLAGFHERQIARITDEKLNSGLPAFLSGGIVGLNSGLMGAQVTATALLAEMRALGPAAVHSISTNGANQDVVSQGTIAARLMSDKLDHLFRIQAIMAIAVAQATELAERGGDPGKVSPSTQALRTFVREISDFLGDDRPLGEEIDNLADRMQERGPVTGAGTSRGDGI